MSGMAVDLGGHDARWVSLHKYSPTTDTPKGHKAGSLRAGIVIHPSQSLNQTKPGLRVSHIDRSDVHSSSSTFGPIRSCQNEC